MATGKHKLPIFRTLHQLGNIFELKPIRAERNFEKRGSKPQAPAGRVSRPLSTIRSFFEGEDRTSCPQVMGEMPGGTVIERA